jgi:hypothetical protein
VKEGAPPTPYSTDIPDYAESTSCAWSNPSVRTHTDGNTVYAVLDASSGSSSCTACDIPTTFAKCETENEACANYIATYPMTGEPWVMPLAFFKGWCENAPDASSTDSDQNLCANTKTTYTGPDLVECGGTTQTQRNKSGSMEKLLDKLKLLPHLTSA